MKFRGSVEGTCFHCVLFILFILLLSCLFVSPGHQHLVGSGLSFLVAVALTLGRVRLVVPELFPVLTLVHVLSAVSVTARRSVQFSMFAFQWVRYLVCFQWEVRSQL